MTEKAVLQWIKTNLSHYIKEAVQGTIYSEDWLGGMTYRETGFLIDRYVSQGKKPDEIHGLMRGDYGQRKGEAKPQYHGFGYMQMDTGSYPDFINAGDWKDPNKIFKKAVSVLEEKRKTLEKSGISNEDAITASYNCGAGNVIKALKASKDVDSYTHQKNYSKEVRRLREIYKSLP